MPSPYVPGRRADHGAKILVVDDDPLSRRTVRAMLERGYYRVETAEGGYEALAKLPIFEPDLVLLDIQMPDMDGLEVCRRIREQPRGDLVPIIFLTGEERPDVHSQAFRVKGDDFLRKPVLQGELIVRIRSLMRLKRLQAEVQEERDTLLDLQKRREQLFQFIVHDLKNPLAAIQMGLDLLAGRDDHPPESRGQIRRLRETAQGMGRMIQNILDIGRAEQVGLELRKTRIAVAPWLPAAFRDLEGRTRHRELQLACPAGLELQADEDFLRRLLLNLVENALKYAPAGSPVRVEARSVPSGVRFEVRDEGPGIPEGMREQIFDRFVRLQVPGSPVLPGSGLGLAFCQLVAQAHGGQIWVEDNPPRGSAFIVELPEEPSTRGSRDTPEIQAIEA